MAVPKKDAIAKAKLKVEQAKAKLQALEARQSQAERKLETRRKIIIGGLLLDAAEKDDRFARALKALLERIDRPHDKAAFEGWTAPNPETTPATPGDSSTP